MTQPLIGRHILIVEDSSSGVAWARFLQRFGGATTVVVDRVEAARHHLTASGTRVPDLALLDFALATATTGSQLAAELRADSRTAHVVRVCMSTHPQATVVRGFNDSATLYHTFIEKPFTPPELVAAVATALATHTPTTP